MKKIRLAVIMSLVIAGGASGQDYHKFKLGLAFGLTKGPNPILALDPAYRLRDALAIGMRFESITDFSSEQTITSMTVNGQYYFGAKIVRPFVGAGFGQYSIGGRNSNVPTKFGFYPRVGVDVGHISLSLEYNVLPSTTVDTGFYDINGVYYPGSITYTYSYFGVKIGGFLGGGRKRHRTDG